MTRAGDHRLCREVSWSGRDARGDARGQDQLSPGILIWGCFVLKLAWRRPLASHQPRKKSRIFLVLCLTPTFVSDCRVQLCCLIPRGHWQGLWNRAELCAAAWTNKHDMQERAGAKMLALHWELLPLFAFIVFFFFYFTFASTVRPSWVALNHSQGGRGLPWCYSARYEQPAVAASSSEQQMIPRCDSTQAHSVVASHRSCPLKPPKDQFGRQSAESGDGEQVDCGSCTFWLPSPIPLSPYL